MTQPSTLAQDLTSLLRTRHFGRVSQVHEAVDSTNAAAAAWAEAGAPEGAVVFAEYQTAGRGRLGRSWQARAGQNLTFSVVLRPALPPEQLGLVTVAASVAVADTLAAFCQPLRPAVKWPNDILLENRKCCGMLLEAASGLPTRPSVILGIGLNVNQDQFAPALADRATSLLLATGRIVPRAPLLAALLLRLEARYTSLTEDDRGHLQRTYLDYLHGLGAPATLRLTGTDRYVHGTLLGITDTGALRLLTPQGLRTFHAGELTTQPS